RRRSRRFVYDLANENADWPAFPEAPQESLQACSCPICRQAPDRLLFSAPDVRSGPGTLRSVYFCSRCGVAFSFPQAGERSRPAAELPSAGNKLPQQESSRGTHHPFQVPSLLRSAQLLRWLRRGPHVTRRFGWRWDGTVPLEEAKDVPVL